jgi:xanthine/CO dehydrogenase XdhC/CoxF family maturation factor
MRAALAIVATRAFEKSALGPKTSKECTLYRLDLADTVGECCAGEVHVYTRDCGKPLTENLQPVNNNSSRYEITYGLSNETRRIGKDHTS